MSTAIYFTKSVWPNLNIGLSKGDSWNRADRIPDQNGLCWPTCKGGAPCPSTPVKGRGVVLLLPSALHSQHRAANRSNSEWLSRPTIRACEVTRPGQKEKQRENIPDCAVNDWGGVLRDGGQLRDSATPVAVWPSSRRERRKRKARPFQFPVIRKRRELASPTASA